MVGSVQLVFKEGLLHEDDYWNFFATKYVKSYAICKMDTYVYNIRQGSITQLPNDKNIESCLIAINDFMEHMDEVCIGAQRDLIFRLAYSNYVNSIDNHYRDMFRNKLRIFILTLWIYRKNHNMVDITSSIFCSSDECREAGSRTWAV